MITREEVRGIIVKLMEMDVKLDRLLYYVLEDDDGWEEEEGTAGS